MAHLVNPVSFRLSYNCYWNNTWALSQNVNYSYINMLDYCLLKYLRFMWDKLKWYRRGLILYKFKLLRIFDKVIVNFIYNSQRLFILFFEIKANFRRWRWKKRKFFKKGVNLRLQKSVGKTKRKPFKYTHVRMFVLYKLLNSYFFSFFKLVLFKIMRKFVMQINIDINVIFASVLHISASFLGRFIKTKLKLNFPFRTIMKIVIKRLRLLLRKKYIRGFKILFSGRFSRRDRSSYYWKSRGKVPLNSISSHIDYSLVIVKLLNSLCGIKVWVNFGKKRFRRKFIF